MKRLRNSILFALLALVANSVLAYDFMQDGIVYNIVSNQTVTVTYKSLYDVNNYKGNVAISLFCHFFKEIFAACGGNTSLASCYMLYWVEREYCDVAVLATAGIYFFAIAVGKPCARCMTGILQNPHAVFVSNFSLFFHVMGVTSEINQDHSLICAFWGSGKSLFQFVDIQKIGLRVYINKLNITSTETYAVCT